jgi:hypothetical protein
MTEVIEIEEVKSSKQPIRIVRLIFRTFPPYKQILKYMFLTKVYDFKTSLGILLTKLFTTPLMYKGPHVYDHQELLSPDRQRFGIRQEKEDKYGLDKPIGVYLINKNGFWDPKNQELLEQRYKLVFAFEITKDQESKFKYFVNKHKSELYSAKNANINYILRKLRCEKFMIDSYNKDSPVEWDCVMLMMRILFEMELIPEFRKNGKRVPLLGLSSHDMAMLLLDMYKNKELNCAYIISREVQNITKYKKGLKNFYDKGCKITRI